MLLRKLIVLLALLHTPTTAALLPWGPGYALALNRRTNTEYAYSYPRRFYRTFTVEMWIRGSSPTYSGRSPFSVAHPLNDNAVLISDQVYLLGVLVAQGPVCPSWTWCHIAVSANLTAYPAYEVRTYLNGQPLPTATGRFTSGLDVAALEEEKLTIVYGQEQDSQLGGYDNTQIFSGHIDEVRVWSTVRTAQEILNNYNTLLTAPHPGSLASYYTFDDAPWDATYFEDRVNASVQRRVYVVDYANATTAPTPPPSYALAPAPLPALAVSTAPLCAAATAGGWLAARVGPGGTLAVPVGALYCGAAGAVTAAVTAATGGTVSSLGMTLSSTQAITFVAASPLAPGAGFNFTVTDGTATVSGFLSVLPNSAPTLATQLALSGDEDTVVTAWVPAVDPDRDIVALEIAVPSVAGVVYMDGTVNRSLRYTPPPNANGNGVGQFALRARDSWGAVSPNTMGVVVSLRPVADPPVLSMSTNFSIYRGQRITIPFQVVDPDGKDPFVIVSDWPTSTQGFLEAMEVGRTWVINEASVSSKVQWASGYGNWSSMYAALPSDGYGIGQIVGTPTSTEYGDSYRSWCPSTIDGGCVNRASRTDDPTVFYTEFFEATFTTPMYLSGVVLVQNYGGDRVSRILVPSDRDATQWKAVMSRDLTSVTPAASVTKYSVESPSICEVLWPVNKVRVEFDTCHRTGWYELDAIQIRGGVRPSKNVLNTTTQLAFRAAPGYTGTVVFGLTATQCVGSFVDTASPFSVTLEVMDTPFVLTTSVTDGWFSIDVGQLNSGVRVGNVQALELPSFGTLVYNGQVLKDTLQDLGSPATLFRYNPYRCDSLLSDTFLVQLGPTAVVQVNIQGCTTAMSLLIPIVVPCVVGPLALGLLGFLWWRRNHGRRDNSQAPKDASRDICVLFTDIQASTLLWGEVPETMSTALDVHHALIRKLIKKYKCYEVKTIGDSFMVACTNPSAALQLALAIQDMLYEHDWEADGLDDVYRRQTECRLPPDAYARLWSGLRVRVGMHFGRAQITFDETTKGYDYYGTVVNAAARIEGAAHGGQVVLSREAYQQVADLCSAYDVSVQSLGAVQLRGLPGPMDLVQVLPASFAARQFPPLRLDHGGDLDDEDDADDVSETKEGRSSRSGSVVGKGALQYPQALDREVLIHPLVRSGTISYEAATSLAYNVFYALRSQLNMFKKPEERKKKLKELCKQWHVPCKVATDRQENVSLGKLALQLMGSVATQMHSATPCGRENSSYPDDTSTMKQPLNRIVPTNHSFLSTPSPTAETARLSLTVDDC